MPVRRSCTAGQEQGREDDDDGQRPHLAADRTTGLGLRPSPVRDVLVSWRWPGVRCSWRTAARSPSASSPPAGDSGSERPRWSARATRGRCTRASRTPRFPSGRTSTPRRWWCRAGGRSRARPSGLRVSRREPGARGRRRRGGPDWVGPPADVLRRGGDKLEAKRIATAAGVPTLPTGERGGARLSGARQGRRRRGRARDARRRAPGGPRRRARGREPRGGGGVRRRQGLLRALPRAPAPRRGAADRRRARQRARARRARLLGAAAPPEGRRGVASARGSRRRSRARLAAMRSRSRASSATRAPARRSSSSTATTSSSSSSTAGSRSSTP